MESLYFIAIIPPADISHSIDEIRKQCSLDYKVYSALKPPVHITLAPPFKLPAEMETKLMASLETARNFAPFDQELKDFDSFPQHTVYINVVKTTGIALLHKQIKSVLKPFTKDAKGSSPVNPHVTIAYRDLHDTYPQIIEAYKKRIFRAHFMVNKFSLLKHNGKQWNIIKDYESRPEESQLKMDF
jgi:2'-5' RNA ligase